jgi:catalase
MLTPEHAIDVINDRFGRHPGRRALHAKGTFCAATFTASPAAAELTRAAHMQGATVEATARVSNGSGDPGVPDYAPEVRGLAVSFHLPDGSRTDIVSQTVPRFPVRTPEEFIEMVRLGSQGLKGTVQLPLFFARRRAALLGLPGNVAALRPPPSYAACKYFAVHAFKWVDAGGGSRFVRYTWLPEAGDQRLRPPAAKRLGRDYLQEEIRERLTAGPARFTLQLQIAAPGDNVDDPSAQWPADRQRVDAGTLTLTSVIDDPERNGDVIVFDPVRVTDGIELSDDPVLRFRPLAYSESVDRRIASREPAPGADGSAGTTRAARR